MSASQRMTVLPLRLRCAHVVRVDETACEAWSEGTLTSFPFVPQFPSPRVERVSPGHLVAVATAPDGSDFVVWRWFDAVVLGEDEDGGIRLWEPGHGEVVAERRDGYQHQQPGSRVYASAGLPGADWWVASSVVPDPDRADVELGAVEALYTDNNLWAVAFGQD